MFCIVVFFFFKQKTAYEMRISDWSSDVCSSDLRVLPIVVKAHDPVDPAAGQRGQTHFLARHFRPLVLAAADVDQRSRRIAAVEIIARSIFEIAVRSEEGECGEAHIPGDLAARSEEHTSELQSLMRSSYAVFCLKKKKITK